VSAPSHSIAVEELFHQINKRAVSYGYRDEGDKARFAVGYLRSFLDKAEFEQTVQQRVKWLRESSK